MEVICAEVQRFFEEYERQSNLQDSGGVVAQFADVFMFADSAGARVVSASDLAAGISKRKRLFDGVGRSSTSLVSLKARELSERYVLAETEWRVRFDREDAREILLKAAYVVQRSDGGMRIVFYLTHQNPIAVLQEKGLVE